MLSTVPIRSRTYSHVLSNRLRCQCHRYRSLSNNDDWTRVSAGVTHSTHTHHIERHQQWSVGARQQQQQNLMQDTLHTAMRLAPSSTSTEHLSTATTSGIPLASQSQPLELYGQVATHGKPLCANVQILRDLYSMRESMTHAMVATEMQLSNLVSTL
jgi:hypothetical protein